MATSQVVMWSWLITFFSPATPLPATVSEFLKDGVRGTWINAPPTGATVFLCKTRDSQIVMRQLSVSALPTKVVLPSSWNETLGKVPPSTPFGLLTLVVDLHCPQTDELLQEASKMKLLKSPYRWLLLNVSDVEETDESCKLLAAELSGNGRSLIAAKATDADVVLVCGAVNGTLSLVDFWGSTTPTTLGKWSPRQNRRFLSDRNPPSVRRYAVGLNGHVFRIAYVLTRNETLLHLEDGVNKQHDFMTKFNWEVTHVLVHMLKGRIETVFDKDWGYFLNGTWTGYIGKQIRGEVELGGTPAAPTPERLPYLIFSNYHTPVRGIFIFRAPPLSYEYNLFTQPFPNSLWLAIIGIVSLGAITLYGVLSLEEISGIEEQVEKTGPQVSEGTKRKLDASLSDVALLTFGAVCQQGSPVEARGLSGRIITLFLFIGILFLYTSYSASIVALLQSTATKIVTYEDFLTSRIQLGIENITYTIYYTRTETDKGRRAVYQKMTKNGKRNPFMTLEEGMKRMQYSYFAFFSEHNSIYTLISDTFQEYEKCGLHEVPNFLRVKDPQLTLSKWSPHKEVVKIALRKIQERGVRQRQLQRYLAHKPMCVNQGGNFQSVAIIDCFAAFAVLGIGFGISISFFIFEKVIFNRTRSMAHRRQSQGHNM